MTRRNGYVRRPLQLRLLSTLPALFALAALIAGGTALADGPLGLPTTVTGAADQTVTPVTKPVAETVDETVAPVTKPVTETVDETVAPVTKPVTETVDQTVAPVTKPVTETVDQTVTPVTKPVTETVEQTTTAVTKPVTDAVKQTTSAVTEPVTDAVAQTTAIASKPVTNAVEQTTPGRSQARRCSGRAGSRSDEAGHARGQAPRHRRQASRPGRRSLDGHFLAERGWFGRRPALSRAHRGRGRERPLDHSRRRLRERRSGRGFPPSRPRRRRRRFERDRAGRRQHSCQRDPRTVASRRRARPGARRRAGFQCRLGGRGRRGATVGRWLLSRGDDRSSGAARRPRSRSVALRAGRIWVSRPSAGPGGSAPRRSSR